MPGSDAAWKTYCVVAARGSFVLFLMRRQGPKFETGKRLPPSIKAGTPDYTRSDVFVRIYTVETGELEDFQPRAFNFYFKVILVLFRRVDCLPRRLTLACAALMLM